MNEAWTCWEAVQKGWVHVINIRIHRRLHTHNSLELWSGAKEECWAREAVGHRESPWGLQGWGAELPLEGQPGAVAALPRARAALPALRVALLHPLLRALQPWGFTVWNSTKEFQGFWWITTRFNECCLQMTAVQLCTLWIPTSPDLAQTQ